MQKFDYSPPEDLIRALENLDPDKMAKEMLTAAGEAVLAKVRTRAAGAFEHDGEKVAACAVCTKVYDTPSDGGLNIKVGFPKGESGYFINRNGVKTAAPLVVNVKEYGKSNDQKGKNPFFRKCFRKSEINSIMEEVQGRYLPKK